MAKELPYFKFEPATWDTGSIQMCTREERSVFIDLCSMYWQRLGDLPYKLAVQKVCGGNATALDSLNGAGIIKLIDGFICIDFLNEQLAEFENTSSKNSENARLGWKKRRNNATPMRLQSELNAIRGEERREDKIKVDEIRKEESMAARDFEWFKSQIDEIWTDQLPTEKKKNLEAAIQNAWEFISADTLRLKVIDSAGCKQLVGKAFQFMKNEKPKNYSPKRIDISNI